jgi:hypothetical protein
MVQKKGDNEEYDDQTKEMIEDLEKREDFEGRISLS